MIKTLNNLELEGNIIKTIFEKPAMNIILSSERLKFFYLRSGARRRCPLPPFLLDIILEVLARAIKQEKEKPLILERKK